MLIGGLSAGIYGVETVPIEDRMSLTIGPGSVDFSLRF